MSEKQPTAYVVCRAKVILHTADGGVRKAGDNVPVKVFDTRNKAREYAKRMNKRSRKYDYNYYAVKQG